jgi:uncharacterized protein YggE
VLRIVTSAEDEKLTYPQMKMWWIGAGPIRWLQSASMTAPIVTVRGEAQLEAPPDLATLSVSLHAAGDTADRTRAQLASGSTAVAELIGQFTTALERSSTSGLHVAPTFNRRTPTKITGYTGTFSATLEVADFAVLSELIMGLSRLPNSQIDGPWWSLRRNNPVYRDVRLAAIADARQRADDYAAAFGATVSELVEVSDLDGFIGGPRMMSAKMEMAADMGDASFSFEPAVQTVSGQVTVRFTVRGGSTGSADPE